MIKLTTNRASWTAFVLLAAGCGGRAQSQDSASVGGSDAASGAPGVAVAGSSAGTPGVGPIDTTGLPTALPIDCPDMTTPLQLALPCKVGASLSGANEGPGTINVLECYDPAGEMAAPSGQDRPVFSTTIPFGNLPMMLNQPFHIPFALPAPPGGGLNLTGTVVFTQVDPVGRAFVARLTGGTISSVGGACTIPDTPFWAVRGDFI